MEKERTFDETTPDTVLEALVAQVRQAPEARACLVELLPEQHPLYRDRSTNEVMRIRSYLLAALEEVGAPEGALPFIAGELDNGRDAPMVAAAAKAARGLTAPPAELALYLLRAVENVKFKDDAVSFASIRPRWPQPQATTALAEIMRTLEWLGPAAAPILGELRRLHEDAHGELGEEVKARLARAIDAVAAPPPTPSATSLPSSATIALDAIPIAAQSPSPMAKLAEVRDLRLEDQDGETVAFGDFFRDKPVVVVFFYTRCGNPNKCSLTITRLGQLQEALGRLGLVDEVKTAAFTYEPGYDVPGRLRAYGANRGVTFGEYHRFFRAPADFERLQAYFNLGVNYVSAVVNVHRVELYLLDKQAQIVDIITHHQWEVNEVLHRAQQFLSRDGD